MTHLDTPDSLLGIRRAEVVACPFFTPAHRRLHIGRVVTPHPPESQAGPPAGQGHRPSHAWPWDSCCSQETAADEALPWASSSTVPLGTWENSMRDASKTLRRKATLQR